MKEASKHMVRYQPRYKRAICDENMLVTGLQRLLVVNSDTGRVFQAAVRGSCSGPTQAT